MSIKAMRFPGLMMPVLIIAFLCLLSGCGTGGLTDAPSAATGTGTGTGGTTTTPPTAASISVKTSSVSVKSDDSETADVTATVLDSGNRAIEGIGVLFSTTGGMIAIPTGTSVETDTSGQKRVLTGSDGKAKVKFSSGTSDQSNRVVTVTAAVSAVSISVPVQVVGSKLTMTSTSTNITAAAAPVTLTVKATDAGENPVYKVPITLAFEPVVPPAVQGSATLSATSGTTDVNGVLWAAGGAPITVTGTGSGTVRVKAEGLGAVQTIDYAITGIGTPVFGITAPSGPPFSCDTSSSMTVTVRTSLVGQTVVFSTSLGVWDGGASFMVEKAGGAAGSTVSATLSSAMAGTATVQVYDKSTHSISDNIAIAFYAPAVAAAAIDLQVTPSVVNKSVVGGVSNTATLTATVRSVGNQVVGDAPVAFSIVNPAGGGETVFPVVVYTDTYGIAKSTFSSGALSTGATASSLIIKATIVGTALSDTVDIIIGGTAGSVVIGYGNVITEDIHSKYYTLPMAAMVADSSGAPVKNQQVSLSAWPSQYSAVSWFLDKTLASPIYRPYIAWTSNNEDVNENMIMNAGEDVNGDGFLTPPNSAAGTIPATVITDENGVANFGLTYLKSSANSIVDRIRASTLVLGTETSSSLTFRLPYERTEGDLGDLAIYSTPITLKTDAGFAVTCKLAPFSTGTSNVFSISSLNSVITSPGGVYTYNVPAGTPSGTKLTDRITVSETVMITIGTTTGWVTMVANVDVEIRVP